MHYTSLVDKRERIFLHNPKTPSLFRFERTINFSPKAPPSFYGGLSLPPLPFQENREKAPQVKSRPHYFGKNDVRVLVDLPQQEIAEPLDPGGTDQQVDMRHACSEHI